MNVCLSGRIVEGTKPSLSEFFGLARDANYDGVGLRTWQVPPQTTPEGAEAIVRLAKQFGLGICSITTEIENVPRIVPLARVMGVKVIQSHAGPGALLKAASSLDPDMRLGPQVHTAGEFESPALCLQALARVPDRRVGIVIEPGNLLLAGVPRSQEALAPLASRIIGCNLQSLVVGRGMRSLKLRDGTDVVYDRVPWRENDQMDLAAFLRVMRAIGYDGYLNVIEPPRKDVPLRDYARSCADFIREALAVA